MNTKQKMVLSQKCYSPVTERYLKDTIDQAKQFHLNDEEGEWSQYCIIVAVLKDEGRILEDEDERIFEYLEQERAITDFAPSKESEFLNFTDIEKTIVHPAKYRFKIKNLAKIEKAYDTILGFKKKIESKASKNDRLFTQDENGNFYYNKGRGKIINLGAKNNISHKLFLLLFNLADSQEAVSYKEIWKNIKELDGGSEKKSIAKIRDAKCYLLKVLKNSGVETGYGRNCIISNIRGQGLKLENPSIK